MYKIGMSSGNRLFDEDSFRLMNENHIDALEISVSYDMYKNIDYKKIKRLSETYGISLWSYHLPFLLFSEIDPSSLEKSIRDNTIKYFTDLIKRASDIGIDKFIVHPSGEPIDDSEREERMKCSMETLDILAEIAHKCGSVIAVEDLPRTCLGKNSEEIKRLISCNDKLRVCFDINHLLSENTIDFMENLKNKIITVHISDYDFVNERHWFPGEGKIDWLNVMNKFKNINYNGVWMYELSLEAPESIIRDRNLDYNDIYKNANELFNGTKLTTFGKPSENLYK